MEGKKEHTFLTNLCGREMTTKSNYVNINYNRFPCGTTTHRCLKHRCWQFWMKLQNDLVSCCNILQFYRVKLQISISITVYLWELLEGEIILLLEFRTRGFAAV